MIRITEFLHASLLVADLAVARAFYEGVLGLAPSLNRPALGFDGVWYEIGRQQIHLLELPNPDPVAGRPEHSGRDRHIALGVDDLEQVKRTLDQAGIPLRHEPLRASRAVLQGPGWECGGVGWVALLNLLRPVVRRALPSFKRLLHSEVCQRRYACNSAIAAIHFRRWLTPRE